MISLCNILFVFNIFSLVVFALGSHNVKIIEGEDADIKDFPYMAALTYLSRVADCGAAIINENTVLTAAHCVYFYEDISLITVTYGSTTFHDGLETNVSKIFVHEKFKNTTLPVTDDIAVLKVDPPIVFSETVQPIKLAQKNAPNPGGKLAKFAGWGSTTTEMIDSNVLQKVDMTIIDDKTCVEIWKDTENPADSEKEICAQADMSDGKKRGPCYGDSGSPLVIDGVQYGIISSFHDGCGIAEYPILFTRVAHYIDWLADKI